MGGAKGLPTYDYITHGSFNAYLVALDRYDGQSWWRWVGRPEDAPWQDLKGLEFVSHNANFDELVARFLAGKGVIPPGVLPTIWNCTADMAAYFQFDRGLDAVAPLLLGEVADKSVRAKMKTGSASSVEIRDYAATDSRQCAWIWYLHHHKWPEYPERFLSREIRRSGYRGVYINIPLVQESIAKMQSVQRDIERKIPWANRSPVASMKGLASECSRRQMTAPPSLALDDPDTEAWRARFDKEGWLENIRSYTKAKQTQAHCEMLIRRVRKDGTVPFELIYRKAPHTARWQSGGGLRMQNLDKDEFEGFNSRWYIQSRPDHQFLIADLSQIEPRMLNWAVNDEVFLDACRKGQSPYDAHAVSTMGFVPTVVDGKIQKLKEFNAGLYALAKARLLALGYQAGPPKFCEMARVMAGIIVYETEKSYSPNLNTERDPSKWEFYRASQIRDRIARNDLGGWTTLPSAVDSVNDFRTKSKRITDFWKANENAMRRCVGGDYFAELPSGEVIRYFDVREQASKNENWSSELTAWVVKNSKNPKQKKHFYGGILTENKIQRLSRDVLADIKARIIKIDPKRLKLNWSVHDEVIAEAKSREAKALFEVMMHEMKTPPWWAKGLPLGAEGGLFDRYQK